MLVIDYTDSGLIKSKEFPETDRGTKASIKFIKQLHEERKNHPWYYKLKKVELLESKLKDTRRYGHKTKKRMEIESELFREEKDRKELLEMCDVCGPPR